MAIFLPCRLTGKLEVGVARRAGKQTVHTDPEPRASQSPLAPVPLKASTWLKHALLCLAKPASPLRTASFDARSLWVSFASSPVRFAPSSPEVRLCSEGQGPSLTQLTLLGTAGGRTVLATAWGLTQNQRQLPPQPRPWPALPPVTGRAWERPRSQTT